MKKSLVLYLFLSLITVFTIIGVHQATPVPEPSASPLIYIPVIGKGQAPFWKAVKSGVDKAAIDYGVRAVYTAPATEQPPDIIAQLILLQTTLANNPQAIALAALDSTLVTPYLENARDAGIPVIGFDSGVDSPIVKTTVATDNYGAGALAANKMAQLIGEKGKVGIVAQDQTSQSAIDRTDGFVDTLTQNYPNIEVIPVRYSLGNIDRATLAATDLLTAHPDLTGIFGTNEGTSEGILNAVKGLDKEGQITVIGFDSGKVLLDAIRDGFMAGAVTQDPVNMGYKAVETALRAYRGEILPEFIDTGFAWYDQSNMDDPAIKPLLYD